eukprot:TRINITY_DN2239_c0_g1_i1.p1 TRINITY_DN2239_c0_g1~~TRINITY_DN2239_c0_g1_i1.p1  ORF type:complete len:758 (+),score=152.17 TRINITY_DN2239_c0_g1_i1:77-2275(+)
MLRAVLGRRAGLQLAPRGAAPHALPLAPCRHHPARYSCAAARGQPPAGAPTPVGPVVGSAGCPAEAVHARGDTHNAQRGIPDLGLVVEFDNKLRRLPADTDATVVLDEVLQDRRERVSAQQAAFDLSVAGILRRGQRQLTEKSVTEDCHTEYIEVIDVDRLQHYVRLGKDRRQTQAQNLLLRARNSNGSVKTTHHRTAFSARRVANDWASLQGVTREARNAAAAGTGYHDLDLYNCYPSLLAHITGRSGGNSPLARYSTDGEEREARLRDITEAFPSCDRDAAKQLLLRIMFGGSVEQWCKDNDVGLWPNANITDPEEWVTTAEQRIAALPPERRPDPADLCAPTPSRRSRPAARNANAKGEATEEDAAFQRWVQHRFSKKGMATLLRPLVEGMLECREQRMRTKSLPDLVRALVSMINSMTLPEARKLAKVFGFPLGPSQGGAVVRKMVCAYLTQYKVVAAPGSGSAGPGSPLKARMNTLGSLFSKAQPGTQALLLGFPPVVAELVDDITAAQREILCGPAGAALRRNVELWIEAERSFKPDRAAEPKRKFSQPFSDRHWAGQLGRDAGRTTLSLILSLYEDTLLACLERAAEAEGWSVGALMFDGLLLRRPNHSPGEQSEPPPDHFLQRLEHQMFAECGIRIKVTCKSWPRLTAEDADALESVLCRLEETRECNRRLAERNAQLRAEAAEKKRREAEAAERGAEQQPASEQSEAGAGAAPAGAVTAGARL